MAGDIDAELFARRKAVLRAAGAAGPVLDEVLAYTANPYCVADAPPADFPLPDEAHVGAWREYADDAQRAGAVDALRRRFPQLRFPIRAGISADPAYVDATKKGIFGNDDGGGVPLDDPAGLELSVAATMGGHVPVLIASTRDDFIRLVQAFTERNEPAAVPPSMGACIVNGLVNWDRVSRHKAAWLAAHPLADDTEWKSAGFPAMAADKSLYQDRLVILSRGPYSALAADHAGLPEPEWLARSIVIRREHEFTHYCTWRLYRQFRTHALDELLADFVGLVRALDRYPPALAAQLLGVGDDGPLREGRLRNYRSALSDDAFTVIARLAARTIRTLDAVAQRLGSDLDDLATLGRVVYALTRLHLEELAADDGWERFERQFGAAGGQVARRRVRAEPQCPEDAVADVLNAFDQLVAGDADAMAVGRDFHLAIDEIVSNVVRHGSRAGTPPRLRCEIVRHDDAIEMVCVDDGPAFDPLQQPRPRTNESLEDRPVGGLGILLVRRLMSEVRYERRDGTNRLRLAVRLSPATSGTGTPA